MGLLFSSLYFPLYCLVWNILKWKWIKNKYTELKISKWPEQRKHNNKTILTIILIALKCTQLFRLPCIVDICWFVISCSGGISIMTSFHSVFHIVLKTVECSIQVSLRIMLRICSYRSISLYYFDNTQSFYLLWADELLNHQNGSFTCYSQISFLVIIKMHWRYIIFI